MAKVVKVEDDHEVRWILYGTTIVKYDKRTHMVKLDHGGFLTATTVRHINKIADKEFAGCFSVHSVGGLLHVSTRGELGSLPFERDIEVPIGADQCQSG